MRAAWYERKGPAHEVLAVGEMPDPEPGPGEVRVRVQRSGVNPSDTKARSGWANSLWMPWPQIIPHQDGAGVIDKVGSGIAELRVGERVWVYEAQRGRPFGTAAEFVVIPALQAVSLPESVDFETAASLGVPAMTAHRCLFADGGIQGQTVLIAGGAGAVGLAAVQLAKWAGARVITTVSRPEQAEIVRAAGADVILNRKTDELVETIRQATDAEGVDRVVEVAFEENLSLNRNVLKNNGVISTYASGSQAHDCAPAIPFYPLLMQGITIHFVLVYNMPREAHRAAARDINACLRAGSYRAQVGRRYPLEEIIAAHEAQDTGQVVGKILITLGD